MNEKTEGHMDNIKYTERQKKKERMNEETERETEFKKEKDKNNDMRGMNEETERQNKEGEIKKTQMFIMCVSLFVCGRH